MSISPVSGNNPANWPYPYDPALGGLYDPRITESGGDPLWKGAAWPGGGGSFTPATLAQIIAGSNNINGVTALGLNQVGLVFATNKVGVKNTFDLPLSTGATIGVITKNGSAWLHDFAPSGADGNNLFLGGAGNLIGATSIDPANGSRNIMIGALIAPSWTTGFGNTLMGVEAGNAITSASYCVAIGDQALMSNQTSNYLFALGAQALMSATSGNNTICISPQGMMNCETTTNVQAIGDACLYNATTVSNSIAIGSTTGFKATTVNNSIMIGDSVFHEVTGGNLVNAIGIGYRAGYHETTGNQFYLDSISRASNTAERQNALLWGTHASSAANQQLTINASLTWVPKSSDTPSVNGRMLIEATSNTTATLKFKGSDGAVRSVALTLSS